jgi:hypothetical protein
MKEMTIMTKRAMGLAGGYLALIIGLVAAMVLVSELNGQTPPPGIQNDTLTLVAPAPPSVDYISAAPANIGGGTSTYYYWVVGTYPAGSTMPKTFAVVRNVPAVGGSTPINVSWYDTGATSYTLLRTTTSVVPSMICTGCVVGTVTGASTLQDTGGALGNLSVTIASPLIGTIRVDNSTATPRFVFTPDEANITSTGGVGTLISVTGGSGGGLSFTVDGSGNVSGIVDSTVTRYDAAGYVIDKVGTGAPLATDCDSVGEVGRKYSRTDAAETYHCLTSGWTLAASAVASGDRLLASWGPGTPVVATTTSTTNEGLHAPLFMGTGVSYAAGVLSIAAATLAAGDRVKCEWPVVKTINGASDAVVGAIVPVLGGASPTAGTSISGGTATAAMLTVTTTSFISTSTAQQHTMLAYYPNGTFGGAIGGATAGLTGSVNVASSVFELRLRLYFLTLGTDDSLTLMGGQCRVQKGNS